MYYSIDLMIYPEGDSVYKIDFFSGRWLDFVVVPADDRTGWDSGCTTFYMIGATSRRSCAASDGDGATRGVYELVYTSSFCSGWRVELLE